MINQKNKLIRTSPLFLIGIALIAKFFLNEGLNIYLFYTILTLSFIASIIIFINSKYSKEKRRNKLLTFAVAITLTLLMSFYFILEQP
jgi:hypothetical protein|tara:strand:- start:248 stop:511 length:264 start_codon:yes stop_codon:yes gene_type:complete